jgi:hypothetical protein
MYKDISTTESFPKTLMIRNHDGGMIWQLYHVDSLDDVKKLTSNAQRNGFYGSTLEDHQPENAETWPDWKQTKSW